MTNSQDPSAVLARLKQIEKDVFDCCDAVQNALGTLNPDRSEREAKAVEYLKEWTPTWMREETFTINEIPEKLGTAEIASLCLEQAEEIKRLREVVDEAAESLNHVRNIAYSSDDHRIMNIAEDGLKKLRPFLPSL